MINNQYVIASLGNSEEDGAESGDVYQIGSGEMRAYMDAYNEPPRDSIMSSHYVYYFGGFIILIAIYFIVRVILNKKR
ncbi:MAG: hypothetical protein PHE17_13030 [Thiothrix sp.]|uniref:hypothetical protein n=1 Tax=Thiothrix sp. TaxID=1032 RepID=UPI002628302E|nr:hypothetical protein [Thiothrix sp.]MDD5393936.1 hypothetical protein [Thiothrix sp.]